MPVFGQNQNNKISLVSDTLKPYAAKFARVAKDIARENQLNFFTEANTVCMREDAYQSLHDFFMEESYDETLGYSPEEIEDHNLMMEQQFENDRQGILESAAIASFNPVIGMGLPMHKYLLQNNVFDNGGITKAVATSPKFTLTMEKRFLVTPEGKEIDLFYEQGAIKDAFDSTVPFVTVEMNLPETGTTDLITAIGAGSLDDLAVESYISAIKVEVITTAAVVGPDGNETSPAVTEDKWINVNYGFTPGYGDGEKRYIQQSIYVDHNVSEDQDEAAPAVTDYLSGVLYKNQLMMNSNNGKVKAIRLTARKDTSNGLVNTCKVKWKTDESFVDIGTAIPINIPISPEEIKDVQALYGENQLSKLMSIIKDVMGNWKDDSIKESLDKSFIALPKRQKFSGSVNFALKGSYLSSDPVTWRHAIFMDQLDTYVTDMIQVWNDPNVDITIIGRTDIIRKIMPINYEGATTSQANLGGIALDFRKTIVSTDNRRYEFISTDKIRKDGIGHWSGEGNNINDLIILLKPRGTSRIMYIVYDYQLYIANDIRNAANPTLPAVHAFDRWKFYEYQPVQGRISILNPTGFEA